MLSSLSRNLNVQKHKSTCKWIVLTRTFYSICSILQTDLQTNFVGTYTMFQVRIHVQYFQVLNLVAVQIKSQFTTNNMKESKLQPIHLETTTHIVGSNHRIYGTVIFKFIFDTQYFRNYHKLFEKHTPNVRRNLEHLATFTGQ